MQEICPIAHIISPFSSKFGIPRQSGIVYVKSQIVFEYEYRDPDAIRGIEEFSHLWLIWEFSECKREGFSPLVRPPRLGGNEYRGVFATRSPFRPNSLGLSCVKLEGVEYTKEQGAVLMVSGADLMNGTPIYDIKPYIPYADCIPEASGGFTDRVEFTRLRVSIPEELAAKLGDNELSALRSVLENDPRPHYHSDPERVYGFGFADMEIKFRVSDGTAYVLVIE